MNIHFSDHHKQLKEAGSEMSARREAWRNNRRDGEREGEILYMDEKGEWV